MLHAKGIEFRGVIRKLEGSLAAGSRAPSPMLSANRLPPVHSN
jgi:hypothetical protein